MANATTKVKSSHTPWGDTREAYPLPATDQTFYPMALVGLNTDGYEAKFDDTQSLIFAGVMGESHNRDLDGTGSAGDDRMELLQPRKILVTFSSCAITDHGKIVYASDDQTGAFTGGTYANAIGWFDTVFQGSSGGGITYSSTQGWVVPVYGGPRFLPNVTKSLAATGTITLTRYDLWKTILINNSGTQTINLPAIAQTQAGDRLYFLKTTAAAAAATLDGNASENIDGSTTLATIDAQYDTATLVSTGTEWIVLSRDIT